MSSSFYDYTGVDMTAKGDTMKSVLSTLPNGTEVRSLWRIHMRHLGLTALDRKPFVMHAACRQHCTEKEAVQQIRKRFTAKWWEDVLITDAEYIGDLHMIDGEALQEE